MNPFILTTISYPENGINYRIITEIPAGDQSPETLDYCVDKHIEKLGSIERKVMKMLKADQEVLEDEESTD